MLLDTTVSQPENRNGRLTKHKCNLKKCIMKIEKQALNLFEPKSLYKHSNKFNLAFQFIFLNSKNHPQKHSSLNLSHD